MTLPPAPDACYRHPDRPSWTLCQRCGRTICPECQIQAPVGVQCPECVGEARASAKASQRLHRDRQRAEQGGPVKRFVARWLGLPSPMTVGIIALTALVGLGQLVSQQTTFWLLFQDQLAVTQPWRLVTVVLVHGGLLHFVFNMLCLYMLGPGLEQRIGKGAFLVSYLATAAAGCVAVAFLAPGTPLVGASGGIFGFFGMYIGLQRMLGGRYNPQVLVIVGVNLLIGLFLSGVSWQAHVGGLVIGLAIGFWMGAMLRDRNGSKGTATWMPVGLLSAAVVASWGLSILV